VHLRLREIALPARAVVPLRPISMDAGSSSMAHCCLCAMGGRPKPQLAITKAHLGEAASAARSAILSPMSPEISVQQLPKSHLTVALHCRCSVRHHLGPASRRPLRSRRRRSGETPRWPHAPSAPSPRDDRPGRRPRRRRPVPPDQVKLMLDASTTSARPTGIRAPKSTIPSRRRLCFIRYRRERFEAKRVWKLTCPEAKSSAISSSMASLKAPVHVEDWLSKLLENSASDREAPSSLPRPNPNVPRPPQALRLQRPLRHHPY